MSTFHDMMTKLDEILTTLLTVALRKLFFCQDRMKFSGGLDGSEEVVRPECFIAYARWCPIRQFADPTDAYNK